MVPLRDHTVLDGVHPDFERLWALCDEYETTGLYPFTVRPRSGELDVEARQFPKRAGYPEDPATGVAACALRAYLARYAVREDDGTGRVRYRMESELGGDL